MLLSGHLILGAVIAFITLLSNVTCYVDQCRDDILGTTVFAKPKKLGRAYLKPFRDRLTIVVPKSCIVTQGVKAHACARDIAPYVNVYNFSTVHVHRKGSPEMEIYIDITAYCNAWGGEHMQENPVTTKIVPWMPQ